MFSRLTSEWEGKRRGWKVGEVGLIASTIGLSQPLGGYETSCNGLALRKHWIPAAWAMGPGLGEVTLFSRLQFQREC